MLKVTPSGNRIFIKPTVIKSDASSLIIIPDSCQDKEKIQQGEIISVGEGMMLKDGTIVPIALTSGQIVVYSKYSANELVIGGESYYIVNVTDVLATIERE